MKAQANIERQKQNLALQMRKAEQNKELASKKNEFNKKLKQLANAEKELINKLKSASSAPAPVPVSNMNKLKKNLVDAQKVIANLKQRPQNNATRAQIATTQTRANVMAGQIAATHVAVVPQVVNAATQVSNGKSAVSIIIKKNLDPIAITVEQKAFVNDVKRLVQENKTDEAVAKIQLEANKKFNAENVKRILADIVAEQVASTRGLNNIVKKNLEPIAVTEDQKVFVKEVNKLIQENKPEEAIRKIQTEAPKRFNTEKAKKLLSSVWGATKMAGGAVGGAVVGAGRATGRVMGKLYNKATRKITIAEKRALLNKLLVNSSISNENKVKIKAVQSLTNFPKLKSVDNVRAYYNKILKNKNYQEIANRAEQYGGIRGSLANLRKIAFNKNNDRLLELINRFQSSNGGASRISNNNATNHYNKLQEVQAELQGKGDDEMSREEVVKLLKQYLSNAEISNIMANVAGERFKASEVEEAVAMASAEPVSLNEMDPNMNALITELRLSNKEKSNLRNELESNRLTRNDAMKMLSNYKNVLKQIGNRKLFNNTTIKSILEDPSKSFYQKTKNIKIALGTNEAKPASVIGLDPNMNTLVSELRLSSKEKSNIQNLLKSGNINRNKAMKMLSNYKNILKQIGNRKLFNNTTIKSILEDPTKSFYQKTKNIKIALGTNEANPAAAHTADEIKKSINLLLAKGVNINTVVMGNRSNTKAFKKLAIELHPNKQGGKTNLFQALGTLSSSVMTKEIQNYYESKKKEPVNLNKLITDLGLKPNTNNTKFILANMNEGKINKTKAAELLKKIRKNYNNIIEKAKNKNIKSIVNNPNLSITQKTAEIQKVLNSKNQGPGELETPVSPEEIKSHPITVTVNKSNLENQLKEVEKINPGASKSIRNRIKADENSISKSNSNSKSKNLSNMYEKYYTILYSINSAKQKEPKTSTNNNGSPPYNIFNTTLNNIKNGKRNNKLNKNNSNSNEIKQAKINRIKSLLENRKKNLEKAKSNSKTKLNKNEHSLNYSGLLATLKNRENKANQLPNGMNKIKKYVRLASIYSVIPSFINKKGEPKLTLPNLSRRDGEFYGTLGNNVDELLNTVVGEEDQWKFQVINRKITNVLRKKRQEMEEIEAAEAQKEAENRAAEEQKKANNARKVMEAEEQKKANNARKAKEAEEQKKAKEEANRLARAAEEQKKANIARAAREAANRLARAAQEEAARKAANNARKAEEAAKAEANRLVKEAQKKAEAEARAANNARKVRNAEEAQKKAEAELQGKFQGIVGGITNLNKILKANLQSRFSTKNGTPLTLRKYTGNTNNSVGSLNYKKTLQTQLVYLLNKKSNFGNRMNFIQKLKNELNAAIKNQESEAQRLDAQRKRKNKFNNFVEKLADETKGHTISNEGIKVAKSIYNGSNEYPADANALIHEVFSRTNKKGKILYIGSQYAQKKSRKNTTSRENKLPLEAKAAFGKKKPVDEVPENIKIRRPGRGASGLATRGQKTTQPTRLQKLT
jgi:membrane protein involved in colicin uptake